MRRWALRLVLLLGTAGAVQAQPMGDPTPLQFRNPAEEVRFHALTAELRCVQCQNQSLADSNAQIAHDLRREVLTLMHEAAATPRSSSSWSSATASSCCTGRRWIPAPQCCGSARGCCC